MALAFAAQEVRDTTLPSGSAGDRFDRTAKPPPPTGPAPRSRCAASPHGCLGLQVLDHAQNDPCVTEMQPLCDKLRMLTTSKEGASSSNEAPPLSTQVHPRPAARMLITRWCAKVQQLTAQLEKLVQQYGLAREAAATPRSLRTTNPLKNKKSI